MEEVASLSMALVTLTKPFVPHVCLSNYATVGKASELGCRIPDGLPVGKGGWHTYLGSLRTRGVRRGSLYSDYRPAALRNHHNREIPATDETIGGIYRGVW